MLALGLLLNTVGIGLFCWLIFTLAVYALPFFVAVSAGLMAFHSGAGILGTPLVGIAAGGMALAAGRTAFAMTRLTILRAAIAAAFAVPAAIVYAAFNGQTQPLIPLFAVGVFVAFTMAQSGMVAHWWHHREHGWQRALAINLVGAVLSGAVAIIAAVTKFVEGAWLVVVLIPLVVLACLMVITYVPAVSIGLRDLVYHR